MTDAPRPRRFVVVRPTSTEEQRRGCVILKEDDEGNLLKDSLNKYISFVIQLNYIH